MKSIELLEAEKVLASPALRFLSSDDLQAISKDKKTLRELIKIRLIKILHCCLINDECGTWDDRDLTNLLPHEKAYYDSMKKVFIECHNTEINKLVEDELNKLHKERSND